MTSNSKKGTQKEGEALKLLIAHFKDLEGYKLLRTWRVRRQGGMAARFQGGMDFLSGEDAKKEPGFDLALWFSRESAGYWHPYLMLVQVKSEFRQKDYKALGIFNGGQNDYVTQFIDPYLCIYGKHRVTKHVPPVKVFKMNEEWVMYRV